MKNYNVYTDLRRKDGSFKSLLLPQFISEFMAKIIYKLVYTFVEVVAKLVIYIFETRDASF